MRAIQTKKEYEALSTRIEELLAIVDNNTVSNDKNFIELNLLSDLVADYEEANETIKVPTLVEAMKLRMYERGLNQKRLSELLGVSTQGLASI